MTDKEWYAKISSLVLEGIEMLNKGETTYYNQSRIRNFIRYEYTPCRKREDIIEAIKERLAIAIMFVGYVVGIILGVIAGIALLANALGAMSAGSGISYLIAAAAFGAIGLVGHIWQDIII